MTQFGGGGLDPVDPGDSSNGDRTMTTTFVQQGAAIDYTPGADTPAGTVVVQGDLVGVTRVDLRAGQLGALAVDGVFDFPKGTGTGNGFTAGQLAFWDDTNKVATKTGTGNKLIGKVVRAAAEADPTVRIRLSQ